MTASLNKKHTIKICMGSSCFARGNQKNLDILENLISTYKINCEVELVGSRCENRCSSGPNIEIDGQLYSKVDSGSLLELFDRMVVLGKALYRGTGSANS